MSSNSSSKSQHRKNRSHSRSKSARKHNRSHSQEHKNSKLFITNIDGKADLGEVQSELKKLFEKHGTIQNIVAKRNRNSEYCFAFIQMKSYSSAVECVRNYDQATVLGKKIKVEFQDDKKRRKDSEYQSIDSVKDAITAGKKVILLGNAGVRKLDDKRRDKGYGRRDRDRSESSSHSRGKNVKTNWKHRQRSQSKERDRSYSKEKKHRRHRNKSRDREDRKKKSKRSSSYSR